MKNKLFKVLPIILLVMIAIGFFWKFFLKGLIPFPGDLLVGAYYPWLESKWGYAVGVPVKNPLISDVFSQIYIWKFHIVDAFKAFSMPLWNPYSYSGYPMLANFQSGVFNPLNILMLFNQKIGWGLLMFGQVFGSTLFMYLFLKSLKFSKISSLVGAVTYGFSGFAIVWLQFATVGQAMIWLPLLLLSIERAAITKKLVHLYWLPIIFLFVVGSGHFQALIYSALLALIYLLYRLKPFSNSGKMFLGTAIFLGIISIGLVMIQILPTIELMNNGIRFDESYIKNVNYGLLPLTNILTLSAPDVFGNATTGNYWGFLNYQETVMYAGILGVISLMFSIYNFKKLGPVKFFFFTAIISLLLAFDTPFGKAIYLFNIPGLSTSAAGRIGMIFVFSIAILTAKMLDDLNKISVKDRLKWLTIGLLMCGLTGAIFLWTNRMFINSVDSNNLTYWITNTKVGLRNLVIPIGLLLLISVVFLFANKFKYWKWLILGIVIIDLFRFGWKYTPFVPETFVFPETEIISFLKKDTSVFRIDRQKAEIMPPNTWMAYKLMSPSGYDPMAVSDYVIAYSVDLNKEVNPGVSRYSELNYYDAEILGKYNVKYLLAIKRDGKEIVPGNNLSYKIDEKEWKRVFQTPAVAVLLNSKYRERVRLVYENGADAKGSTYITSYENNKVLVKFTNIDGEKLLLADTYYPGWKATINGKPTKIGDEIRPFRTVDIRGISEGEVIFEYKPSSFRIGLIISVISLAVWIIIMLVHEKK